jgi:ubiquinone/menaquinone biosynthesis C-methylase UbiE
LVNALKLDNHCFHCIIGPDRAQFLREAFRVLKPAGVREEASQAGFIVLGSRILPRRNDREMDLHPAGCDETLKAPPRALSQSEDLRLVYGAGWVRSWFRWRSRRRQGVNGSLIKPKAAKRKASGIRAKENGRGV